MKWSYWTRVLLISLLMVVGSLRTTTAQNEPTDSLSHWSDQVLVVEMAQLIKQYAHFFGNSYDAWADTTQGLKLYVSLQQPVLSQPGNVGWWQSYNTPKWYYIDFTHPIKPDDLKIVVGRNDNFYIEASKNITKRAERTLLSGRVQREIAEEFQILFPTNKNKRTTDFRQLHERLQAIISQLIRQ